MANAAKKKDDVSAGAQAGKKGMIGYAGIGLAILGIFVLSRAQKDLSGRLDWLWWAGAVTAAVGMLMWFFAGMPRDQAIEWVKSGCFALGLALLIRWPIAEPYRIPSGSMEPTLHGDARFGRGDRVFVNKWIYGVRYPFMNKRIWYGQKPERWDIVVFKAVGENPRHSTLVKRIVGLPGEKIQIRDDCVYVNGSTEPLPIPEFMPKGQLYTSPTHRPFGVRPEDKYSLVPEGHYLVLGDNSDNSADGRTFGWLPNEHIVGRVSCIWWWPQRWRDFTGFSQTLWWRGLVGFLGLLFAARLLLGRSWMHEDPKGRGMNHYFVSFLSFGLRLPFTRIWILPWGQPKRGQVVLYHPSSDAAPGHSVLLGRIAALPGESVRLEDGKLRVDGAVAGETGPFAEREYGKHHPDAQYGLSKGKGRSQVPLGHYYILAERDGAEDTAETLDSRVVGWVPRDHLVGRALAVWWPPIRWRRVR